MLRSLKEVQADDSVVGFYQASTLEAFLNQALVDTQAIHQDKLRHGGLVIVHGKLKKALHVFIAHVLQTYHLQREGMHRFAHIA
jgi:hypothetical protein